MRWVAVVGAAVLALLVAAAMPAAAAVPAETAVVEQVLQRYAARDWAGLRALLEGGAADGGEAMEQALQATTPHLGAFLGAVLGQREALDEACVEQRQVLRHRRANVGLRLQACLRDGRWQLAFLEFTPPTRALVELLFQDVLAKALGTEFEPPHCATWPRTPGEFDCRALARSGETLDVTLALRGPGELVVVHARPVVPLPASSRAVLEPIVRRVLAQYSARGFEAIGEQAGGSLRDPSERAQLLAMLDALHRLLGPVESFEWKDASEQGVSLDVAFARRHVGMLVKFAPDLDGWRFSGITLGFPPGSPEWSAVAVARLQQLAARLSGDAAARLECAGTPLLRPGLERQCALTAHGRTVPVDVTVRAEDAPADADAATIELADFPMIVHGMLAGAAPELGWEVESVDCGPPPSGVGGRARCRAGGADGVRELTLVRFGQVLRFVDVARVPEQR